MVGYVEYLGVSLMPDGGMADLGGYGIDGVRVDVVRRWGGSSGDVIRVYSLGRIVGYVVFSRSRGIYVWAKPDGTAKMFNPATGRLTKPYVLTSKAKKDIAKDVKEFRERHAKALAKRTVRGY